MTSPQSILQGILQTFSINIQPPMRSFARPADATPTASAEAVTTTRPITNSALPFSAIFNHIAEGGDPAMLREAIEREIDDAAGRHDVDPSLIRAVIRAESSYRPHVVSHAGAMGLMQLMPRTAASLGVTDPFDIRQNIDGGTRYLRSLLNRFDNDLTLALAAYNAGQGTVRTHGGVPPWPGVHAYISRVKSFKEEYVTRAYAQAAEDSFR